MRHVTLPFAACRMLGLVPSGMVRAEVYGLDRVQRRGNAWVFRVVEPWKLALVREVVRSLAVSKGASLTRRTLLGRLGP
ncbi:MAG TPA: hypothetical protein VGK83_08150 [Acidimicrobiia bacterium]